MAYIEWKEIYSINVKDIDEQHKKLIGMINELHDAMKVGEEMIDYAASHFATEEKYMSRVGFPEYGQHKDEHDAFTRKIMDFKMKYDEGSIALSFEVMDFLEDWCLKHIQGTEREYGPSFNAKGLR